MIQNSNSSIKTEIGSLPNDFDVAIASIDAGGTLGELNTYVLNAYDYDVTSIDTIDVSDGYFLMQHNDLKPILFIVTVGQGYSGISLKKNLTTALSDNFEFLINKNVWVPLMGTGSGGLEFVDSYDTTIGVLKQFPTILFTIAIPDNKKGNDFINQFRVDNLKEKTESSSSLKTRSKTDTDGIATNIKVETASEIGLKPRIDQSHDESKAYTNSNSVENKTTIPDLTNIVYGQKIGEEISKYNIFFLPKNRYGGISENGITSHILNILNIKKNRFEFSEKELEENGYQWISLNFSPQNVAFCFIVTMDKDRTFISFKDKLAEAANSSYPISNLNDYGDIISSKVFIPFLGSGYARMPYEDSLLETLEGVKIIRKNSNVSKIRINFPRDLDKKNLSKFANIIQNELDLEKDPEYETYLPPTITNQHNKDKIPFHLDNVEKVDRLNREPVAKSLARLVNNEIFSQKKMNHSFMIHLQGEWGSGKSTFLNLLEKHLDSNKKKEWVIINYNAWQNQHINPPWWTFIDQIYRQTMAQMKWKSRIQIWFNENFRRILWYSSWYKIMTLVISIVLFILILIYGGSIFNVIADIPATEKIDNKSNGLALDVFAKLLVSIGSVIGLIYSVSKFLSTPFLLKSSGGAKSFMLRAADPMNRIKAHFNKLIANINKRDLKVAVFIDDIDRCNKEYTVALLEGIQTLFKEKRVLYVVAGDKNWITTCFEANYKEFLDKVTRNNEQLGDLFLEKAFQLSVRMPNISKRTKENYWNYILGFDKEHESSKEKTILTDDIKHEVKEKVKHSYSSEQQNNPQILSDLEEKYNLSEQEVSDIAIEALDETAEDIRHLFSGHYKLINPNPRAIKRLANNYTMNRNTLIAERKQFDPNKLFRWLIIDDMYPGLSRELRHIKEIVDINPYLKTMELSENQLDNLNELLFDKDMKNGGQLEIEDIRAILGI